MCFYFRQEYTFSVSENTPIFLKQPNRNDVNFPPGVTFFFENVSKFPTDFLINFPIGFILNGLWIIWDYEGEKNTTRTITLQDYRAPLRIFFLIEIIFCRFQYTNYSYTFTQYAPTTVAQMRTIV